MSTPTSARVPGAASIQVLGRVAGRRRTAAVLTADTGTILLDLDGFCLGLLGADAVQLPCGVRTKLPTLPTARVGDQAVVADGVVELPRLEVLLTEIVDNTVPVLSAAAAGWGAAHLGAVAADTVRQLGKHLPADAPTLLRSGDPRVVDVLLGSGPSGARLGEDVLAGWLAAAVATRHPALPRVRTATILAIRDTVDLLSSTLLGCASRGETVPEFRALLAAVDARDAGAVEAPLGILLSRRTSGGAGLVLGALQAIAGAVGSVQDGLASAG